MFAITGITGQVGGTVARALLASGENVRAVVRDARKGEDWARQGCEIALAEMSDERALQQAFTGVRGVLLLLPPIFDPAPGFPEMRAIIAALKGALAKARPARVVSISTVGAQATQENLLTQHTIHERELRELPVPVTFLRPAWFMENAAWDVVPARDTGILHSFLQPLDRPIPMVATADIGRVAALELLREYPPQAKASRQSAHDNESVAHRVVELEGPRLVAPNDIAASFARLLGRAVRPEIVPRDRWESLFRSQGMRNPLPRMQMLDGFNDGWLTFEHQPVRGSVDLDTVLRGLIERSQAT